MKAKQLANVIGVNNSSRGVSVDPFHDGSTDPMMINVASIGIPYMTNIPIPSNLSKTTDMNAFHANYNEGDVLSEIKDLTFGIKKPVAYNLQGIKDRLKER